MLVAAFDSHAWYDSGFTAVSFHSTELPFIYLVSYLLTGLNIKYITLAFNTLLTERFSHALPNGTPVFANRQHLRDFSKMRLCRIPAF